MPSRNAAAALSRRYLLALWIIAGLIVLDQVLIQPELARLSSDAPVINVSGRQRMLSQNLTKTALMLARKSDPEAVAVHRRELGDLLQLWTRSHRGLQSGDAEMGLPGDNAPEVQRAFLDLEPHFRAMHGAASRLTDGSLTNPTADLEILLQHEPEFLSRMHAIVGMYEESTRQHVRQLERTSWTIAVAILVTAWVLYAVAIRPAAKLLERRYVQTQDRYQALVDSINEGLLLLDTQQKVTFVNRQLADLRGCPAEALLGCDVSSLFARLPADWDLDHWSHRSIGSNVPYELEFIGRDGAPRPCWISPRRLTNEVGAADGWVVIIMDVSERRSAERRAQQLTEQLAHADRLKSMGEIAAGLAHEVNQPLAAIANYAEGCLARIATGDASVSELTSPLQRMLAAALRAGRIIHSVKRFSQNRPQTMADADIHQLLKDVMDLYAIELQRHSIQFRLNPSPVDPIIECDALQIGQVLTNILQNALQALKQVPAPQRIIDVSTEVDDLGNVRIVVADTGPGIRHEILDRLFEPFSTTRPDGLGMGLSIVRSIVAAHDGEIRAYNRADGGAEVTLLLPRHPVTVDVSPQPEAEVCRVA